MAEEADGGATKLTFENEDIVAVYLKTTQHGLGSEAGRAGVTLFDDTSSGAPPSLSPFLPPSATAVAWLLQATPTEELPN